MCHHFYFCRPELIIVGLTAFSKIILHLAHLFTNYEIYLCIMDVNFSLPDIGIVAKQFLREISGRKVIAFHGEMGAGKTTFIHAVCEALEVADTISSPTFSIINEYTTTDGSTIYHMDLYRLRDTAEAIGAGVEDCLYSGNLCLVEWPDKAPSLFDENTIHCYLKSTGNNERKLQIKL